MDIINKKEVPSPQEMAVALFFKEGTSDKEYHAHVIQNNGQWAFQCHYGKRGQSLTTDPKVPVWVDFPTAFGKYADKVNEKLRKGYTPEAGAKPFTTTNYAPDRVSGLLPQLLNPITKEVAERLIDSDDWVMQEKKDGRCKHLRMIRGHEVVMVNRKGLIVPASTEFAAAVEAIDDDMIVLHGEDMGAVFFAFDIRQIGSRNLEDLSFDERDALLEEIAAKYGWLEGSDSVIQKVRTFRTKSQKRAFFEEARERRLEGVVFKKRTSVYKQGRPNSGGDQLKYKFKGMATCAVLALDAKGKRSMVVGVRDASRLDGTLRPMGKCTIKPNLDIPAIGSFVEIEYLYAYPDGALYQPVFLGPRDDKDEADTYESLKFKAGTVDGDDDEG